MMDAQDRTAFYVSNIISPPLQVNAFVGRDPDLFEEVSGFPFDEYQTELYGISQISTPTRYEKFRVFLTKYRDAFHPDMQARLDDISDNEIGYVLLQAEKEYEDVVNLYPEETYVIAILGAPMAFIISLEESEGAIDRGEEQNEFEKETGISVDGYHGRLDQYAYSNPPDVEGLRDFFHEFEIVFGDETIAKLESLGDDALSTVLRRIRVLREEYYQWAPDDRPLGHPGEKPLF